MAIGAAAYAVTLSGRKVSYIAPLSVEVEVGLGLFFLMAATLAGLAAAVCLALDDSIGEPLAWAAGGAVSVLLLLACGRRLWARCLHDIAVVEQRRAQRRGRHRR